MEVATTYTIDEIQDAIVSEFGALEGDREAMISYIIELGEKIPLMNDAHKNESNIIKGCVSTVWIIYKRENDKLFFEGDSNTAITKGLISILFRVLSGREIREIVNANLYLVSKIGILNLIGPQRSSGFGNMLSQMNSTNEDEKKY